MNEHLRFPVKVGKDKYVLWSKVVNGPLTQAMPTNQMLNYAKHYWSADKDFMKDGKKPEELGYSWDGHFWTDPSLETNNIEENVGHKLRQARKT